MVFRMAFSISLWLIVFKAHLRFSPPALPLDKNSTPAAATQGLFPTTAISTQAVHVHWVWILKSSLMSVYTHTHLFSFCTLLIRSHVSVYEKPLFTSKTLLGAIFSEHIHTWFSCQVWSKFVSRWKQIYKWEISYDFPRTALPITGFSWTLGRELDYEEPLEAFSESWTFFRVGWGHEK